MNIQPQTDEQSYEYTTFPRVFVTYAWFKPLLVALLTAVFTLIISGITLLIGLLWLGDPALMGKAMSNSSPYYYSGPGLLVAVGGVAGMLPALALAERIVRGRPFSSYSSSRGGWNWAAYVKSLVLAVVVFGAAAVAMAFGMPDAGADGISLINTMLGMRIDLKTRKPVIANTMGGFSGPAIFPVAVRMVYQVANAVKIPVVGMGGVSSAEDVIEMMLAGATAVEVGAANLVNPYICRDIVRDLPEVMAKYRINSLNEIIGGVK